MGPLPSVPLVHRGGQGQFPACGGSSLPASPHSHFSSSREAQRGQNDIIHLDVGVQLAPTRDRLQPAHRQV